MEKIELRRQDRARPEDWAWGVVERSEHGVLSTQLPDGQPYCVPLNFVCEAGNLYFHSAKSGLKIDCLRRDARVCISFIESATVDAGQRTTRYRSASVFGKAREVEEESERRKALALICARFSPGEAGEESAIQSDLNHCTIFCVENCQIQGKENPHENMRIIATEL